MTYMTYTYIRPESGVCCWLLPVDKVDVGEVGLPREERLHSVRRVHLLLPHGCGVTILLGLWEE